MSSNELPVVFCYVYLQRSKINNNLYIGFTRNLRKRLAEHNNGLNRATMTYLSWELLYYEAHRNEMDARLRERYLKTTAGDRALRKMLQMYFTEQRDLSKQKVYY